MNLLVEGLYFFNLFEYILAKTINDINLKNIQY